MKLFITCRNEDKEQARAILAALAPDSQCRWLTRVRDHELKYDERAKYASEDRIDIELADLIVVFGNPPYVNDEMTERDIHTGYAYSIGQRFLLLGHKPVSDLWCSIIHEEKGTWVECYPDTYADEVRKAVTGYRTFKVFFHSDSMCLHKIARDYGLSNEAADYFSRFNEVEVEVEVDQDGKVLSYRIADNQTCRRSTDQMQHDSNPNSSEQDADSRST